MSRKTIIAGNWKMHLAANEAEAFVRSLVPLVEKASCGVYIAPPFTSIEAAKKGAQSSKIQIGAQNMSEFHKGAYTGEISSEMLKEAGATFVIIGHSERRHIFQEDNEMIHRKLKWALEENLEPILCIGETEEERSHDRTKEVLHTQLSEALKNLKAEHLSRITVAYEPVWAIGTGKTATPELAQETHALCRAFLLESFGEEVASAMPILYGGSVKPDNIGELINRPDIDGALVGGASLKVDSFAQIIQNVKEQ